jgi:hypothetical protein
MGFVVDSVRSSACGSLTKRPVSLVCFAIVTSLARLRGAHQQLTHACCKDTFNGYKQHVATDLDTDLILACAITPANRPEEEATPQLKQDLDALNVRIGHLFVDRGYINSDLVEATQLAGGEVVCKPWLVHASRPGLFKKTDF